ncbi:glycosyltransferase [Thermococcus paralvinellae]|uniref:Putative glycosyl transferase n=1 Tax=Thermococcus paralvinellae TaxID=582419 RepID=W0IA94_9EURY|nr:glycosyltransferase [Thermococcus paralvinellae]AHF81405.1 putative glycosyl transferase [Thermococcus paralvinellae]
MTKLKILVIPANYPSEKNPIAGIFIKEFARAISKNHSVKILYAYFNHPLLDVISVVYTFKETKEVEDGIETIKVEVSGVIPRIFKKRKLNISNFQKHNKCCSTIKNNTQTKNKYSKRTLSLINNLIIHLAHVPKLLGTMWGFRKLLKEGWKPDIIHAHGFYAGIYAVILSKIYDIPLVVTEHWSGFPKKELSWIDIIEARVVFSNATVIITPTHYLKKAIMDYGMHNNFQVVPNPINSRIFYSKKFSRKRTRQKRLLFVGRVVPQKGIIYLIYAIRDILQVRKDILLEIIGHGPYKEECERVIKSLGIEEFIKFLGLKPQKEVARYMRRAHIYIQPSEYETFGMTFFESLSCGTPVIGTRIPALKENINNILGILVPPRDTQSLKNAILYMLDNYRRYPPNRLSRHVLCKFGHNIVAKKIDKIYQKVINSKRT